MMSEMLAAHVDAALEDAEDGIRELLAGQQTLRQLNALCDSLRVAGIGELFLLGRSAPLRRRMYQSGRAYAHGLAQLPEDARFGSRARPFFDAVAADDSAGASEIARLSRRTWVKGKEFEEDFLFVELLMQAFFLSPGADLGSRLDHWKEILNGTEDKRLSVVRALLERDGSFSAALTDYLEDRATRLEESAKEDAFPNALLATEWHFSVEGTALAKLARNAGLALAREYRHVPAVALQSSRESWSSTAWRTVEPSVAG